MYGNTIGLEPTNSSLKRKTLQLQYFTLDITIFVSSALEQAEKNMHVLPDILPTWQLRLLKKNKVQPVPAIR